MFASCLSVSLPLPLILVIIWLSNTATNQSSSIPDRDSEDRQLHRPPQNHPSRHRTMLVQQLSTLSLRTHHCCSMQYQSQCFSSNQTSRACAPSLQIAQGVSDLSIGQPCGISGRVSSIVFHTFRRTDQASLLYYASAIVASTFQSA